VREPTLSIFIYKTNKVKILYNLTLPAFNPITEYLKFENSKLAKGELKIVWYFLGKYNLSMIIKYNPRIVGVGIHFFIFIFILFYFKDRNKQDRDKILDTRQILTGR